MNQTSATERAILADLVSLWQRRHAEGHPLTPAELCRERPELLPQLERNIAVLAQMPALADVTSASDTLENGRAGKDGELTAFLAPAEAPDELGRFGGYRVLEILGRGGMGVVFRAEDPGLCRQLALKAMLPTLAAIKEARDRFLREARTAAAVEHDNVVAIHQVGEERGIPFLAMPLLRGESLDDRLKREGRLPLGEALRIGREAALGLAAAHKCGLIHRDIKPANLWLEEEIGRVKVLDFGLARALNASDQLTRQGAILGTPAYMSPEQSSGAAVDTRSDLFSLGCVLYRMVTGQLPFQGKDTISTLLSVARDVPPAPAAVTPDVPLPLSDFILKMLSKNPAGRPASAQEVARTLQGLGGEPAADNGTVPRTWMLPQSVQSSASPLAVAARPHRRWVWGAAAVMLSLLIGGGLVATIVIRIKGPGSKEVEINVPDGSTVSVEKDGKIVVGVDPDAARPPKAVKPMAIVDDSWAKEVAALPVQKQVVAVATRLKKLNPGFDGQVRPTLKDGVVVNLDILTLKVKDISPVRALPGLQSIDVHGWPYDPAVVGELDDLSPLKGMQLTEVHVAFTRTWNLEPLKGMKLTKLVCYMSHVSDLSPMRGMKLKHLNCGNTPVSDLSPVKGMPLTFVNIMQTPVSDLSPLKGAPLTELYCWGTQVSDLSPLKGMPLTFLDCHDTKVTDLAPLQGLSLKTLFCDFVPERDATILRSIKTLKTLNGKPAQQVLKAADVRK